MAPESGQTRQARAVSFGAAAGDYDRYRIGPPSDLVDRFVPRGARAVLDLGAGTGAVTRQLIGRAQQVFAVDPDRRMTEVLERTCPSATTLEGRAEAIPLPNAVVDAVVVASAWHWVDPIAALSEVARVLKPSGRLSIVWNRRDRSVPWVADLEAFRLEVTGGDDWVEQRIQYYLGQPWLPPGSPFTGVEISNMAWTASMSRTELTGLMTTFHGYISAPAERKPEMLRRFTEYVEGDERITTTGIGPEGDALVEVPMLCHLWQAKLR